MSDLLVSILGSIIHSLWQAGFDPKAELVKIIDAHPLANAVRAEVQSELDEKFPK